MKKVSLLATSVLLAISTLCFADTIHVPTDQPTIQAGIDVAINGDVVLVAPGTYVENIDFKNKAITVQSEQGANVTIIDGGEPSHPHYGSCVLFDKGEGLDSVLDGFTLQNGTGTYYPFHYYGGGIYCNGSSPTIKNNIIQANSATTSKGGGICCWSGSGAIITNNVIRENSSGIEGKWSSPTIMNNHILENDGRGIYIGEYSTIKYNLISGNLSGGVFCSGFSDVSYNIISYNSINESYALGGGVYCGSSFVTVTYNIIHGNSIGSISGGGGGGVYTSSSPLIANNIITENSSLYGGGIEAGWTSSGQTPRILYNIICGNRAEQYGGGIACAYKSSPIIASNTIYGNTAENYGGGIYCQESLSNIVNNTIYGNTANIEGGGIYAWSNSNLTVINSILRENTAPSGKEIYLSENSGPSMITISYSNVDGGLSSVEMEPGCSLHWNSGMIDADPLFVDESNNDFHLTFNSPCRSVGNSSAASIPFDYENDQRIAYGKVDMGADEFFRHLYCTGDLTPGGAIQGKIVGLPGTSPVGLFVGAGVLDPPLQHKWGEFYLESPWVLFPLVPIPANGVLEIPATLPGTPAPYDIPMQALIGWDLSNLFVVEVR